MFEVGAFVKVLSGVPSMFLTDHVLWERDCVSENLIAFPLYSLTRGRSGYIEAFSRAVSIPHVARLVVVEEACGDGIVVPGANQPQTETFHFCLSCSVKWGSGFRWRAIRSMQALKSRVPPGFAVNTQPPRRGALEGEPEGLRAVSVIWSWNIFACWRRG